MPATSHAHQAAKLLRVAPVITKVVQDAARIFCSQPGTASTLSLLPCTLSCFSPWTSWWLSRHSQALAGTLGVSQSPEVCLGVSSDAIEVSVGCAQVDASQAPYLCLDLSFLHTLLTEGFRIQEGLEVTLVKRVRYQSQEIEAAWPLGAAINLLS